MTEPTSPDVFDRLLEQRRVFLSGPLDAAAANRVAAQLMALDGTGPEPVTVVVNSPGGPAADVLAVLDTMEMLRSPVSTVCIGQAAGTAALVVVLAGGVRRATARATLSLRLGPESERSGTAEEVGRHADQLRELVGRLAEAVAERADLPVPLVREQFDHGTPMTPAEALDRGLLDEVV